MNTNAIIQRLGTAVKAIGLAILIFAGLVVVLYQRVQARAEIDRAQHADAIIVLGSAVWANERASPAPIRAYSARDRIVSRGVRTQPDSLRRHGQKSAQ
jgi:hypothetical protein